jgi:hypothetical protein
MKNRRAPKPPGCGAQHIGCGTQRNSLLCGNFLCCITNTFAALELIFLISKMISWLGSAAGVQENDFLSRKRRC